MENKNEFRIVECQDYFIVQKKIYEYIWSFYLGIIPYIKKTEQWVTTKRTELISKDTRELIFERPNIFKTKQECIDFIENYDKYPIYHYL